MTKRCLDSVIPHVNESVHDTTLFICDNNSTTEMKEWLKGLVSDKVRVLMSNVNIGKAKIVNKIYNEYGSDCDYVISIDSDLIADEPEYNFIDESVQYMINFPEFGLLSTFQKNNDQHIWQHLTQETEKQGRVVCHGEYCGIAGGCVILNKNVWDSIGNYNTYGEVYGYDDGLLIKEVYDKSLMVGVIRDVKLTHPLDNDEGYADWKLLNISRRSTKGYYEQNS